ncbi:MAG: adenylosuccinate lyase [Candidatus Pacebacteria bacterium]|jgi:adenylosuccinate lyase|nr:adenylosuccinate lyase [Marinobacter sp.]MDP6527712.1 adenylosuccinate lyase [Candidatus Paceibacterota bacterium]|tara:strand:- start:1317 stop:2621 length:1305 start_codon:yes stop_codon:yes gene_type:complete
MINALSPLDGRYLTKTEAIRPFFSEKALIRARLQVEIEWFLALSSHPDIKECKRVAAGDKKKLRSILERFNTKSAEEIKRIEKQTNHDVKAVEYFLKSKMKKIPGCKKSLEFVHFALTSEDVNNLAYGIMIHGALKEVIKPELKSLISKLSGLSKRWGKIEMLSLTHGQPATPTTVGKELAVFVERLERQQTWLNEFKMQGKFGGAVGNYSAHKAGYPKVKWEAFGKKFMRSLGVDPMTNTTQINPHDDVAELSHIMCQIDTILIDFSRDVWMYISRGVFGQKIIKGEVGSSTMPHKVNPIDFENAEGNLGLANALFQHFAEKLPISRLQRDLTDSTVQRSIGSAFGYYLIAIASLKKGIGKLELNKKVIRKELDDHPEVRAEAIQIVLRKYGVEGAYEKLKKLTRGEKVTHKTINEFVKELKIPEIEKRRLVR